MDNQVKIKSNNFVHLKKITACQQQFCPLHLFFGFNHRFYLFDSQQYYVFYKSVKISRICVICMLLRQPHVDNGAGGKKLGIEH